jgi:hypothetical protein
MNFVGHLAIARRHGDEPTYWLGAMLPDFASMAGVRLAPSSVRDGAVAALVHGVAHHHAVDDVFHATAEFVGLTRLGVDALISRGIPRGAARAVAHIGVELLLDGELDPSGGLTDDYLAALRSGESGLLSAYAGASAEPLEAVRLRLVQHGYPKEYAAPREVARYVVGILARRPSLAVPSAGVAHVADVLAELKGPARAALPAIVAAVHAGLAGRAHSHNER